MSHHQQHIFRATRGRPPVIRVIRVVGMLNFGGAEMRTVELLPRLADAGIVVDLVTLCENVGPGPLAPTVRRYGGSVYPLALDRRFPRRFLRLLRQLRPTAVHADLGNFSGALLALAAVAGVPTRVAHFRGDDTWRRSPRRRMQRVLLRRLVDMSATDVLGVSPSALSCGYSPSWPSDPRCRVVLNGLDLDRLLRPSDLDLRAAIGAGRDAVICLTVGRASREKRTHFLPSVIVALLQAGIDAHAVLVGPSHAAADTLVHTEADRLAVSHRIHQLGPREDIGGLLRQADVVLAPSILEGLPGSVLEAAAVGTPVVSTDLPGARFIADRLPGITLIDQDAAAQVWATAVRVVLGTSGTHDRAGAVARFESSVFSLDAAVAEHLTMYHRRARVSGSADTRTY
ncbi:Glycosyltransferase involved in cell wall bisynthesis [Micromonospora phaseoli]|uniref:Glycosyltransferase involved in cell wall bisynthesis n=1 Tax=Micromonospora phaseoli TaxID=1144548 RepID=A0A1H6SD87_9ACTN|nr:glycosyltransferase family 4 protein [Micromonospora phaseoli]PZW03908.1 glycosyltransferase involved in cell wall biosynthesis [Micromonospora phaseoli]GIJ77677.1 hypothetical protein Xph01_21090 [Micromonospora phaseoli]SEI65819.1 Glycosyltransferase involved in cell wall bisynthesis [Micromonospora phaseoli]